MASVYDEVTLVAELEELDECLYIGMLLSLRFLA